MLRASHPQTESLISFWDTGSNIAFHEFCFLYRGWDLGVWSVEYLKLATSSYSISPTGNRQRMLFHCSCKHLSISQYLHMALWNSINWCVLALVYPKFLRPDDDTNYGTVLLVEEILNKVNKFDMENIMEYLSVCMACIVWKLYTSPHFPRFPCSEALCQSPGATKRCVSKGLTTLANSKPWTHSKKGELWSKHLWAEYEWILYIRLYYCSWKSLYWVAISSHW